MKADETEEFVDPVLKAAVKRAWGTECCPFALRSQVCGETKVRTGRNFGWMIWPAAIAAMVLVAIGGFSVFRGGSSSPAVATVLPVSFQNDLIACHDHCCREKYHHHLPAKQDDNVAMADAMKSALARPVLVAEPIDPAWRFTGASICNVGAIPAGHLVFLNGRDALSVFSLPGSACSSAKEGQDFQTMSGDHPIVGFAKDGALFCFVESGSKNEVSVEQLAKLRDQMRSQVTASMVPQHRVALAELILPALP